MKLGNTFTCVLSKKIIRIWTKRAWDKDSEQTHAQLHGLVCTQGSATCIASWALYHEKKCNVVALLDNEKIQVTFSYQLKEGKLTKIEKKKKKHARVNKDL